MLISYVQNLHTRLESGFATLLPALLKAQKAKQWERQLIEVKNARNRVDHDTTARHNEVVEAGKDLNKPVPTNPASMAARHSFNIARHAGLSLCSRFLALTLTLTLLTLCCV